MKNGLIYKWLKSENTSSKESKRLANKTREALGLSHKDYRKLLSWGREKGNVLERLMSANEWGSIDFGKLPSKAGFIYRNAFANKEVIAERYKNFIASKETKVNAGALYPYEISSKVLSSIDDWNYHMSLEDTERKVINKYWSNLKDYFNGNDSNILCVVDTSGSMYGRPMDVAISLGIYCGERNKGAFKDHFISFSSRPTLIKIEGIDFCDKVRRIYAQNLCENTNLTATFDLLLDMVKSGAANKEDLPKTIVVISDMEIDRGYGNWSDYSRKTEMQAIKDRWAEASLEMPNLVYWNVDARQDTILDEGENISLVSGCSPVIFESVISGKNGKDLMLKRLNSDRYAEVSVKDL